MDFFEDVALPVFIGAMMLVLAALLVWLLVAAVTGDISSDCPQHLVAHGKQVVVICNE